MKESGAIDDPHGQMEHENLPEDLCYTMYTLVILAVTFIQTSFVYIASIGHNYYIILRR